MKIELYQQIEGERHLLTLKVMFHFRYQICVKLCEQLDNWETVSITDNFILKVQQKVYTALKRYNQYYPIIKLMTK